ncbi:hypothetical protein AX774_g3323, partial [Zancudomyces culisetae]
MVEAGGWGQQQQQQQQQGFASVVGGGSGTAFKGYTGSPERRGTGIGGMGGSGTGHVGATAASIVAGGISADNVGGGGGGYGQQKIDLSEFPALGGGIGGTSS